MPDSNDTGTKKRMNLPNRLTLFRLMLVPFCVLFIVLEGVIGEDLGAVIAAVIFAVASVTDALDGKIARKYNLISDFGKFLDPLADKFLVIGSMTAILYSYGSIRSWYFWVVIVVIFREFAVTSLRLIIVSSEDHTVVAANMLGKIKTTVQIINVLSVLIEPVIYRLIFPEGETLDFLLRWPPLTVISSFLTILFTLWSLIVYFRTYGKYITRSM